MLAGVGVHVEGYNPFGPQKWLKLAFPLSLGVGTAGKNVSLNRCAPSAAVGQPLGSKC